MHKGIVFFLVLAIMSCALFSCAQQDPLMPYNHDVQQAIKAGDLKAVKSLVTLEPEWKKMHLLHMAAEFDQLAIAKYLMSKGLPTNMKDQDGKYPLDIAAKSGSKQVILLLIEKGADIEQKDDLEGQTPLMAAVKANQKEAVELLISKGAQIDARDKRNFTPLNVAAGLGHEEIVEILRRNGAR
jgi:ankyrin repeat protein